MKRLLALLLLLSACAPTESGSLGPAPTSSPRPASAPPSATVAPSMTVEVWLVREAKLFPTRRVRPATLATSRLALTELVTGPSEVEAMAGVGSAVEANAAFDLKGVADGVAAVSFPTAFDSGGAAITRLRQAQIVYTLTQFPTVSRVDFQTPMKPVGRADYADLLPPIVVTSPAIGQHVSSPITVSGSAVVQEATVTVRVLDAAGKQIATRFTTSACGAGCRGAYSLAAPYRVCGEQAGTVEVYEVSGDGAHLHVARISVVLQGSTC